MVRTLTVHLDDEDYEEAKDVKLKLDVTWEEFVKLATEELSGYDRAD